MASPLHKTKNWSMYSSHYSPAVDSAAHQEANFDPHDGDLTTSRGLASAYLPYGRQRSVFPYGIVSDYESKDGCRNVETSDKTHQEKLVSIATRWSSSPCLGQPPSAARWGTKILQTSARSSGSENGDSTGLSKSRRRHFRWRMHSCPSTPVNDSLRIEIPKLSSIMVQAQSLSLVSRPLHPSTPTKPKTSCTAKDSLTRRLRSSSVKSIERQTKPTNEELHNKEKTLSKTASEIKIENGVIFIENGKAIDLRKDKLDGKHKRKTTEAGKSKSYREFQDAMQKFEDAQLNLEEEVNTKVKTFERCAKEQEFFNEHVQTQFLDLFSAVKEKRKMKNGKKYRC